METVSLSMGRSQSWFRTIRKKLFPSSHTTRTILNYSNTTTILDQEAFFRDETLPSSSPSSAYSSSVKRKELSEEDIAATKIQAIFRAHLARRAFRALKSLVKLQAVVRGACARRQARIALHCVHILVRLQLSVRSSRLLYNNRYPLE